MTNEPSFVVALLCSLLAAAAGAAPAAAEVPTGSLELRYRAHHGKKLWRNPHGNHGAVARLDNATPRQCALACSGSPECESFDVHAEASVCFLHARTGAEVGGLTAAGHYDHYERLGDAPLRRLTHLGKYAPEPTGQRIPLVDVTASECANQCDAEGCTSFGYTHEYAACVLITPGDQWSHSGPSSLDWFVPTRVSVRFENARLWDSGMPYRWGNGAADCAEQCRNDAACAAADDYFGGCLLLEESEADRRTLRAPDGWAHIEHASTLEVELGLYTARKISLDDRTLPYAISWNASIPGNNYAFLPGADAAECVMACQLNDACRSFDLGPEGCYLSNASPLEVTPVPNQGYEVYTRTSAATIEPFFAMSNVHSYGGPPLAELTDVSLLACQRTCLTTNGCESIDYLHAFRVCQLNDAARSARTDPDRAGVTDHYRIRSHVFALGSSAWWYPRNADLAVAVGARNVEIELFTGEEPGIIVRTGEHAFMVQDGVAMLKLLRVSGADLTVMGLHDVLSARQLEEIRAYYGVADARALLSGASGENVNEAVDASLTEDEQYAIAAMNAAPNLAAGNLKLEGCAEEARESGSVAGVGVTAGCHNATFLVAEEGFAFGAGLSLASADGNLGDKQGSHVGLGVGLGIGADGAAKWGEDDQYGFSASIKIFSVSLYVKGEDVTDLIDDIGDGFVSMGVGLAEALSDMAAGIEDVTAAIATGSADAWSHTADWFDGAGSTVATFVVDAWEFLFG